MSPSMSPCKECAEIYACEACNCTGHCGEDFISACDFCPKKYCKACRLELDANTPELEKESAAIAMKICDECFPNVTKECASPGCQNAILKEPYITEGLRQDLGSWHGSYKCSTCKLQFCPECFVLCSCTDSSESQAYAGCPQLETGHCEGWCIGCAELRDSCELCENVYANSAVALRPAIKDEVVRRNVCVECRTYCKACNCYLQIKEMPNLDCADAVHLCFCTTCGTDYPFTGRRSKAVCPNKQFSEGWESCTSDNEETPVLTKLM